MAKSFRNTLVAASTLAYAVIIPSVAGGATLSGTNLWTTSGYTPESGETSYTVPSGNSMSAGTLFIGKYNDGATGNLAVTGAGTFTPQSRGSIYVGSSAGSSASGGQGTLTVAGGGTLSNAAGDFYIKLGGQGGAGGAGGAGLFVLSDATVKSERLTVGGYSAVGTGGAGTATVNAGGVLNLNYLDIASRGSGGTGVSGAGTVRINTGGSMKVAGEITLGTGYPNDGAALLSVEGGTLTAASSLTISHANQSSLNVSNGGTVAASGTILVTGNGNGISISNGGTLTSSNSLNLGGMSNVAGDVTTVTVTGGTLNTTGATEVGVSIDSTTAKLIIGNGGVYNNSGALGFAVTNFGMPVGGMQVANGGTFNLLSGGRVYQHEGFYGATPFGKPITIDAGGTWNIGYGGGTSVSVSFAPSLGVVNNGLINFCQSDALSLAAEISGNGGVAQIGAGTTTLSGANTYTGGTTVSAGTLAFSSSSNLGTGPLVISGGTAKYTGGAPISLPRIDVSGNSTSYFLTTQDATTSDDIHVADGSTLVVGTASTPTKLTIKPGTSIIGALTVLGTLVNQGTLTPNDPTIVNVTNFNNQGGTVNITIAGNGAPGTVNGYDQIRYSGTATINGGVLKIVLLNGYVPAAGEKYAVIQGGGTLTGAFSFVTLPVLPSGLYGKILYGSNALEYDVLAGSPDLSAGEAPVPPVALSPVGFVAMDALVIDENRTTANFLRERAQVDATARQETDWSAFVSGHGATTNWGGSSSDNGTFDHAFFGGKVGLSHQVGGTISIGIAAGYDIGRAQFHDEGGNLTQDRGSATVYVSSNLGGSGYLYAGVTGGYSQYSTRRDTIFGRESGKTTGLDIAGSLGVGTTFKIGGSWFTSPYASATYTRNNIGGFTEEGSINDSFVISDHTGDSLRARIGNDFGYAFGSLRLSIGGAYEREFLDATSTIKAAYLNGSGTFEAVGKTLSQDTLIVTPRVSWGITPDQTVSLSYSYEYGLDGTTAQQVNAAYSVRF